VIQTADYLNIQSKLPEVGTTIFTVMSRMAAEEGAINLSQGFPDFNAPEELLELVTKHMRGGHNQYAPMEGLMILREQIAAKVSRLYGLDANPETDITVTSGATEALHSGISALVQPGDEAIVFEPAYDSYIPSIELNGGIPVTVPLNPQDFSVFWDNLRASISERTRLIIINTPHNPTGTIWSKKDLDRLAEIVRDTRICVLSDEVYEHIVFDGNKHHSVLTHPELSTRSIAVFSFGKTFHSTGWKIGYMVAPTEISWEIRKVHQFLQFSVHTPSQYALAEYMASLDSYQFLADFYQQKRDLFLQLTTGIPFKPLPSRGTYFQLFSYEGFSEMHDRELAERMTKEKKVACIPISVFYQDKTDNHYLRFCFCKDDETLERGAEMLRNL
jgi:methionine transaminase